MLVAAYLAVSGVWRAEAQSEQPAAPAQAQAGELQPPAAAAQGTTAAADPALNPPAGTATPDAGHPAAAVAPTPARKTYTVPAGTKVLLQLRSAVNTKSAKAGDGVYLASTFPVVVGNRVLIPAGVYVQGVVDRVERAGRVKGRAQLEMHFTSMIFPNGTVVEIPGLVNSLPGASKQNVKDNGEGTIEQEGDKTRNLGKVAEVSIPAGGTVGSIAGLGSGHPLAGGLEGMAAGLAAAGIVSLFTRGADVNIESGSQVEMVLQRPLLLEEENLTGAGAPALVPSADQPKPMEKPNRARVMCPPGGLGCD
jgi:type IV secretion system protein VirB10